MGSNMKSYNVVGPFLLSFIIEDEQRDILFNKNDGGYIETNGVTVWYVTKEKERYESITTANIVDVGLLNKALLEIPTVEFNPENDDN